MFYVTTFHFCLKGHLSKQILALSMIRRVIRKLRRHKCPRLAIRNTQIFFTASSCTYRFVAKRSDFSFCPVDSASSQMPKYLISHYNIASTLPMEDGQNNSYMIRKMKLIGWASKRPGYLQERGAVVDDGRHKRVWKACERCRTKKIKV
jgi:hypothetical protein